MNNSSLIYHYTSFEKLQCILKHGTLRFKESTKSNDILDTMGFVKILKTMPMFKSSVDITDFILKYYQQPTYTQAWISLVSCFSLIPDSRLLWDSYTMHRPGKTKCTYGDNKYCLENSSKYNGVCIAFRQNKLEEILSSYNGKMYDNSHVELVRYGESEMKILINKWLKEAIFQSTEMSKEKDQQQTLIPPIPITSTTTLELKKSLVIPSLEFMKNIEAYSPFFKHEFWKEEKEVRATILISNSRVGKYKNIITDTDGSRYCDISITPDCIDHIILGPEFSIDNKDELEQHSEYKLHFSAFTTKKSIGTGVIRNI